MTSILVYITVMCYIWYMDNNFEVRNLKEEDYKQLCEWWNFWKFPPPLRHALPDSLSDGLMVSYKGEDLCAGFIYRTSSSSLFWIEWIVSTNKIRDKEVREYGIKYLINGLCYMAEEMGARVIWSSLVNKSLIDKYVDCGFVKSPPTSTEMIKVIK